MRVEVRNHCTDYNSYRSARVKSLFNVDSGADFDLDAQLPIEDPDWQLGVVVGPSGSGKTSIGRQLWGLDALYAPEWPTDEPIVDVVAPGGDFDAVTAALANVGLGSVPSWLRPFPVLSVGEQFRANLARLVADPPDNVVVDEFSSVVDRQIACVGSMAFAKAWRRTAGRAVLLTCHYDVLEWLQPDWVYDTGSATLSKEHLQRPKIEVDIYETSRRYWPMFKPHHYLKADPMPFSKTYVGFVGNEPVVHMGMGSMNNQGRAEARACRMVVMPEWQGAGVGMRFLNTLCERYRRGEGHLDATTTMFHTSHPGLCAALRRDGRWRQVSANLYGGNKVRSAGRYGAGGAGFSGFGGHFRAVQGFRYYGEPRTAPAATAAA